MATKEKLEELNLTQDELERIGKALKNEEFRKLFAEYAEEISDPENRKRYEEEIKLMEAERGMDVKFVHPKPGHVIKTSVNGKTKAFVNICTNENIKKPSSSKKMGADGKYGLQWSIPHSFAPPREDVDKSNEKCQVYDVVFHPDTYRMTETNARFKKIVHDTALDGIENQFDVKLDKKNIKLPKIKFKGMPTATIIRSKNSEGPKQRDPDDILSKIPFPDDQKTTSDDKPQKRQKDIDTTVKENESQKEEQSCDYTKPHYTMKHRSVLDMQDFRNAPDAKPSTRPKELVVEIELPLLKSASPVSLDVFEKRLFLESTEPAKYRLDIDLPYSVDENEGSAKFDKSKRKLVITLPVITLQSPDLPLVTDINGTIAEISKEESSQGDGIPERMANGLAEVGKKELIEVLSSMDAEQKEGLSGSVENGQNEEGTPNKHEKIHGNIWEPSDDTEVRKQNIIYTLPQFSYTQDAKSVSFIIHTKNVANDTVMKTFQTGGSGLQLKFVSVGDGCFPIHFSLLVQFPFGCNVEPEETQVDVCQENMVVLVKKKVDCTGIWDVFHAGIDQGHLQEKFFLTDRNLSAELDQLDEESMPSLKTSRPDLEVTEMNEDHITVEIRDKDDQGPASPKDTVHESSDEIEVIHEHASPKLRPIIKQRSRTLSESSDDILSSSWNGRPGSESPISESEEGSEVIPPGRKKSVSFSEYVDHTTYKINQSVSTMHAALKNRRRRHRKKEEKREERSQNKMRRRRHSSGSDCGASSDEHSSEYSSQYSEPDEKDLELSPDLPQQEPRLITKPAVPIHRSDSNSSTECVDGIAERAHRPQETSGRNKKKNKNKKGKHANKNLAQLPRPLVEDITPKSSNDENAASTEGCDLEKEAKPSNVCPVQEMSSFVPSAVKNIVPDLEEEPGRSCDNAVPVEGETIGAVGGERGSEYQEDLNSHNDPLDHRTNTEDDEKEQDSDDELEVSKKPLITEVTPSNRQEEAEDEPAPPVESMLNWKESSKGDQEHKTQCAFSFSNSVIYDLDLD